MATRMQQRRGTAAQWTAANPVLAAGEIGFETDTSKFKMGNGSSTWSALQYFANASELAALVNGAPGLLDTLDELAQAIGDDPQFYLTIGQTVTNHTNASTMVHGIADTSLLATQSDVNNASTAAASDLSDHTSATTTVHGIADTSLLATQSDVNDAATAAASDLSDHTSATTTVHGIADTSLLATQSDVNDAETAAASALAGHAADTAGVHGIADTTLLVTQSDLTDHAAETVNVHGIADTTALVTQSDLTDAITGATVDQSALAGTGIDWNALTEQFDIDTTVATKTYADDAVTDHNAETLNVHGIANTALLATQSYADTAEADAITAAGTAADTKIATAVAALTKSSVGLGNVDNTSDADKPVSTATQTALDAKASLSGATFTGSVEIDQNLTVDGNLTVNGTTFNASATSITIEDNMVQLANQNAANTVDLGIVVAYNDGAAKHSGIVRDVSADKWKLFKGVTTEPSTTVDFTQGSLDDLEVAGLTATTVTASSGVVFSDGTQTKEGVPSRTPIIQKTAAYTLSALTERDSLIEVDSTSAVTLSIPTDASVNYPVGTTIDILQTNTGQVTIAAATPATTTVNATPGLKLRTRWSSATLLKRAANTWVVYGDLTA
jgi:Major tropism determinant N-terminal domain